MAWRLIGISQRCHEVVHSVIVGGSGSRERGVVQPEFGGIGDKSRVRKEHERVGARRMQFQTHDCPRDQAQYWAG